MALRLRACFVSTPSKISTFTASISTFAPPTDAPFVAMKRLVFSKRDVCVNTALSTVITTISPSWACSPQSLLFDSFWKREERVESMSLPEVDQSLFLAALIKEAYTQTMKPPGAFLIL